jgi:hypothetical protein
MIAKAPGDGPGGSYHYPRVKAAVSELVHLSGRRVVAKSLAHEGAAGFSLHDYFLWPPFRALFLEMVHVLGGGMICLRSEIGGEALPDVEKEIV